MRIYLPCEKEKATGKARLKSIPHWELCCVTLAESLVLSGQFPQLGNVLGQGHKRQE